MNRKLFQSLGYINGKFTVGSSKNEFFNVINPSNGKDIMTLPNMGLEDTTVAIQSAYEAWKLWKNTTGKERSVYLLKMSKLMLKYSDDLATLITLESGKPFQEAKTEVSYASSFYEFCSEEAKRINGEVLQSPINNKVLLTIKQAVGPCALITPWNFPSAMITRKVAPALAAGCTVVIKPSEETPLSALALCAIADEVGLPNGVLNCLTVGRSNVEIVGKELCNSDLIRKVSFTGSTVVGKWLMRESASTVKKVKRNIMIIPTFFYLLYYFNFYYHL
jgi:succinate-semialdehyde dehydrogenase/glutarate-semialdehyde dehydrogenase